jgi:hypothetical protein
MAIAAVCGVIKRVAGGRICALRLRPVEDEAVILSDRRPNDAPAELAIHASSLINRECLQEKVTSPARVRLINSAMVEDCW